MSGRHNGRTRFPIACGAASFTAARPWLRFRTSPATGPLRKLRTLLRPSRRREFDLLRWPAIRYIRRSARSRTGLHWDPLENYCPADANHSATAENLLPLRTIHKDRLWIGAGVLCARPSYNLPAAESISAAG